MSNSDKKIGLFTASSVIIANMIGTGVFTSIGFQAMGIESGFALVFLWIVGGVVALCGALVYGEIGSRFPGSGGEYHYLSQIYHPAIGFLSGWVSITVGFAAPVAAASMAMSKYVSYLYPALPKSGFAASVVLVISIIHAVHFGIGKGFQNVFTTLKVAIISVFIAAGFWAKSEGDANFSLNTEAYTSIFSAAFAISLYFVGYSYSGWNAAAYIAGEIENPQKNLPKALLIGTGTVTILYVLLNYIFIKVSPLQEIKGQVEVGAIASTHVFGQIGGKLISIIIALLLISSISAMVMVGPRVSEAMGKNYAILRFLSKRRNNTPLVAIFVQGLISLFFIFTATFDQVITYIGFTLNLFLFMTVIGVFIARYKQKSLNYTGYKTFLYPFTPLLFLFIETWVLIYGLIYKPIESQLGLLTVFSGFIIYYLNKVKKRG
ncbi:MAG: amino acid permease [Bacteroidia bacterium]|nr:amino acid permease [Bacteroidia bacterium]MDW8348184.1 amino acid permease [Bacteroidia bacterium]